ncbi:hypothetical protein HYALB_00004576 [Hymenoscyphus albidus]|uniref:Amino-acid acetyltransferase, mitochondrial n=1 Tax=Hymenoscyphus albidus TaxID=595503 RepID=A0A9N9M0C1_9HELO|nr:hypothetical protein HYALB_00004576 [Hymenoscyphus albidus]
MVLQNIALKKGKEVAGHNLQQWSKRNNGILHRNDEGTRYHSVESSSNKQLREELAKEHVKELSNKQKAKKEAREIDKDFFMSVLGSTATKREAKAYLQRFSPPKTSEPRPPTPERKHQTSKPGVNLGVFYAPTAVEGSPKFVQHPYTQKKTESEPQLHVALVKIRAPQELDDKTLSGVGRTLSQLARLGLISVVVVDCDGRTNGASVQTPNWRDLSTQQANRVVTAIDSNNSKGARLVDNVIAVNEESETPKYGSVTQTNAHVILRTLLMTPLKRGIIPVLPTTAYTNLTQTAVPVTGSDTVLALLKELAGLPTEIPYDEDPIEVKKRMEKLRSEISVDRLIILDPLGGVPTPNRPNGYHVFLNMEQEFEPARHDLLRGMDSENTSNIVLTSIKKPSVSGIMKSNPVSKLVEQEFGSLAQEAATAPDIPSPSKHANSYHLQNLKLARSVLALLPPSSSAILTTPDEAANSGRFVPFQPGGVGTRRSRNPLIHNLLTDKPVFSSSLPVGRLGQKTACSLETFPNPASTVTPTTFAKHGMPITIFPNPVTTRWEPPMSGKPQIALTDPRIDLPRLVHLIDDSFGRKLDVSEYLKRVDGRIAGVIIAGEYEGGALLIWELPPGVVDDGSPESRARMVPYLDKFAVLKRSQGSGGVADAVFTAMVRDCFPNGVVWRSRTTNVVNKWYFERSRGTWKLPGTGWTMFWTTPDMDRQTFLDYEGVCRGIEPSWADGKKTLD